MPLSSSGVHLTMAPELNGQSESSLFNQFACASQPSLSATIKSAPNRLTHRIAATIGVVVTVDVTVVVGVDVPVVVVVDVGVVVNVVVAVVVCDVVGVVTSQLANPPTEKASVMALMVATVASHAVVSTKYPPNAQSISGVLPAGPLNSRTA